MRVESGQGGLRRLVIETERAEAQIYLHGAHVTHFQPRGQKPVLFMSARSSFEAGKPIRGGVPLCFPWFGARQDGRRGPSHGFARVLEWDVTGAETRSDGTVEIGFRLLPKSWAEQEWDGELEVDYRVTVGSALGLELRVGNPSNRPVGFEAALHTYLAVGDVRQVSIEGLAGTSYLNTVGTPITQTEGAEPIRITAETDRIYKNTRSTCVVRDPVWQRQLVVQKTGSNATVLWNPWIAKAKAMADFGDEEWPSMLCIETCNVREHTITLAPGQSHAMQAIIQAQ